MIKKILCVIMGGYLFFCAGVSFYRQWVESEYAVRLKEQANALKTNRILPENIPFGAYLAGIMAKENKDWQQALEYLKRVLKKDPENIALKTETYLLELVLGDFDKAIESGRSLALSDNVDWLVRYALWADLFVKKDFQSIIRAPLDTQNGLDMTLSSFFKAWTFAALGDYKNALQALEVVSEEKDLLSLYWYQAGLVHLYFKQDARADEAFQKLKQSGVSHASIWLTVSRFYQKRNQWNEQNPLYEDYNDFFLKNILLFELLTDLSPNNFDTPEKALSEAIYGISSLVSFEDEYAGLVLNAIALKLNPEYDLISSLSAEIFENLKVYEQAIQYYDRIRSPSELVLLKKGILFQKMGRPEFAFPIFQKLTLEDPDNSLLLKLVAESLVSMDKPDLAISYYSQAIINAPKTATPNDLTGMYIIRGGLYEKLGYSKLAERDFLMALSIAPEDPILLNDIGYRLLEQDREIETASNMIARAIKKEPHNPYILDSLAYALYKQGKYNKALPLAEKAANRLPESGLVAMHLGDIYQALKRTREARFQYKKALDFGTDLTDAQKERLQKLLLKE